MEGLETLLWRLLIYLVVILCQTCAQNDQPQSVRLYYGPPSIPAYEPLGPELIPPPPFLEAPTTKEPPSSAATVSSTLPNPSFPPTTLGPISTTPDSVLAFSSFGSAGRDMTTVPTTTIVPSSTNPTTTLIHTQPTTFAPMLNVSTAPPSSTFPSTTIPTTSDPDSNSVPLLLQGFDDDALYLDSDNHTEVGANPSISNVFDSFSDTSSNQKQNQRETEDNFRKAVANQLDEQFNSFSTQSQNDQGNSFISSTGSGGAGVGGIGVGIRLLLGGSYSSSSLSQGLFDATFICPSTSPGTNKELVLKALAEFYGPKRKDKLDEYFHEKYNSLRRPLSPEAVEVFHDLIDNIKNKSYRDSIADLTPPYFKVEAKGDLVWTQSVVQSGTRFFTTADIFRVECGKIREHWDIYRDVKGISLRVLEVLRIKK